jgi:hypothetical protein
MIQTLQAILQLCLETKKNLNDENTMHYFVTTENENSFKTSTNTLAYFAKVPVGETKKVLKR